MWFELKGQQYSQSGASVTKQTALVLIAALSLAAAGCGSAQNPNQLPGVSGLGQDHVQRRGSGWRVSSVAFENQC